MEDRGSVRVLTLDRPERRNALSSALQADLVEALLSAPEDGDVRALVLTGNGPALCAGFDLEEIRAADEHLSEDRREGIAAYLEPPPEWTGR